MKSDFIPPADPWTLFKEWFALAKQHESSYPEAMALATVSPGLMPTVRTVLMKDFDSDGIVFHTNRESRKAMHLKVHPKAGVCFHWKSMQRQIHIEGTVETVSDAESDAYFLTRPRENQIGAWASLQSRPLESRDILEKRHADFTKTYEGKAVPRPPYWGGYRLSPSSFEFWQEQAHRLHDRIAYLREKNMWLIERRYP